MVRFGKLVSLNEEGFGLPRLAWTHPTQVCYLEALRQLAGASSAGAGRGAAVITECGGAALNDALFEVLKIGDAAAANFESPGS